MVCMRLNHDLPGEWPITSSTDIYAVCDLIKSWFRVLPGGVFSSTAYDDILRTVSAYRNSLIPFRVLNAFTPALDGADLDTKVSGIRRVVHSLSASHFELLKRIIEHLDKYVHTLLSPRSALIFRQSDGLRGEQPDDFRVPRHGLRSQHLAITDK